MITHTQLVVDSVDPHPLADWWAEALGWAVEPQDETFIRSMVEQGHAEEADTTTHRGHLVWRTGAAIRPAEELDDPQGRRILFQQVPEAKTVKNRLHLDLRVDPGTPRADEIARLVAAGATVLYEASQGPYSWTTLADPQGNEFCVTG
ncbi:MAG TPA: VOC family protein [Nocardioides sp.]|uniref:VOC family protein n=1 Tax=Nocardioides sp. TaxID=35761 RepID=UPI002C2F0A0A|nr:VOC family protein [Nocardioides sp.]HQR26984.1 VOC family protein [Nocardioides sp.]